MAQCVLIVTSETDATASYVCDRFDREGIRYCRFNTESFPQSWHLHWPIHPRAPIQLCGGEHPIATDQVSAVWYRRPAAPVISQRISEPAAQEFALRECEQALAALWQDLDALWVNHPAAIRYATRKPHQLRAAAQLGFIVPETILSSDAAQVDSFWRRHNGDVVFKPLHQDAIEIAGRFYFAYASKLTAAHLVELHRLTLSPVLFQQYVPPKREIRVTVIGDEVFAAAIDTSASPEPDWRRLAPDRQQWQLHDLPSTVADRCVRLLRRYDLLFGAIDLILSAEDEYVFLELNANGQWVWIELITGQPMSEAMTRLLSGH
jgi:glutathione synthase/RimK-type ligase-like ATP-grasp enzyme